MLTISCSLHQQALVHHSRAEPQRHSLIHSPPKIRVKGSSGSPRTLAHIPSSPVLAESFANCGMKPGWSIQLVEGITPIKHGVYVDSLGFRVVMNAVVGCKPAVARPRTRDHGAESISGPRFASDANQERREELISAGASWG